MNTRKHLRQVLGVGVGAMVLLSSCTAEVATTPTAVPTPRASATAPASTAVAPTETIAEPTATLPAATVTPMQVVVPRLSGSPELIPASQKPPRETSWPGNVVYTLPATADVLLASELTYADDLLVDLYYPPGYDFSQRLPFVILSHGFVETTEFDKDIPSHIDWGKLIAASGLIAVSAQAGAEPNRNGLRLLDYLAVNATPLGLDPTRIGFWACSGQGGPTYRALQTSDHALRDGFRAAVFIYLDLGKARTSAWPVDMALMVVKAGKDEYISASSVDDFVTRARDAGLAVDYIELPDAVHGFDVVQDTTESRTTVEKALTFLKATLLPND